MRVLIMFRCVNCLVRCLWLIRWFSFYWLSWWWKLRCCVCWFLRLCGKWIRWLSWKWCSVCWIRFWCVIIVLIGCVVMLLIEWCRCMVVWVIFGINYLNIFIGIIVVIVLLRVVKRFKWERLLVICLVLWGRISVR